MKKILQFALTIAFFTFACIQAKSEVRLNKLFDKKLIETIDIHTIGIGEEFEAVDLAGYKLKKSAVIFITPTMNSISRVGKMPKTDEMTMQILFVSNLAIEQMRSEGYTLKSTLWGVGQSISGGSPSSLTLFFEK